MYDDKYYHSSYTLIHNKQKGACTEARDKYSKPRYRQISVVNSLEGKKLVVVKKFEQSLNQRM